MKTASNTSIILDKQVIHTAMKEKGKYVADDVLIKNEKVKKLMKVIL